MQNTGLDPKTGLPPTGNTSQFADTNPSGPIALAGTINSSALAPVSPYYVPTPTPDTTAAGVIASANPNILHPADQAQKNINDLYGGVQQVQQQKQSALDQVKSLLGMQSDLQSAQVNSPEEQALAAQRSNLTGINSQIANEQVALRGELDAIRGRGDISQQAQTGLNQNVNDIYGRRLADLAIRQSAATGNIQILTQAADRSLQLKLAPLQTQISYYQNFLDKNLDALSTNEKDKLNSIIAEKNNLITQTTNRETAKTSIITDALKAGAKIPDDIAVLANNPNTTPEQLASAMSARGISFQANKYSPLPFGTSTVYNPATGEVRTIGSGNSSGNTLAVQNNNPGNLKDTTGNFVTFNSPEEGQQALIKDLTGKMTGATSTGLTAASTLQDLANVWAPTSDNNNPKKYAQDLANQLGISVNTQIGSLLPRVSDLAAAIAKNEGGQFIDAQAPLKIANQFGISLSPEQASAFNQIPASDQGTVAGILSGKRLISGLTTRQGYNQTILNYAQKVDPTFDSVSTEAGQKFQLSGDTQKFIANANTASNTLDQIITLSNQVDRGNVQILNNGLLKVKQGVSDPNAVKLATLSGILADELGKILGSSQGTDFTIQLGQSLVDPSLSQDAFAAQANLLKDRIANKLTEYQKQGNQAGSTSNPIPISSTNTKISGLQVTLPDGSTATFPDQNSLNKFKQDHGL